MKQRAAAARAGKKGSGTKAARAAAAHKQPTTISASSSSTAATTTPATAAAALPSRVERTLERQEKAKAEEEALRGRGGRGDEDEWRLEYLKGLNAGLDNQKARLTD